MINTIWKYLQAVLVVMTLLFIATVTDRTHRTQLEQHESQYRAACEAVKGKVAWNGNHWECLR